MTRVSCERHGSQGGAAVSRRIDELIRTRTGCFPREVVRIRDTWLAPLFPMIRAWVDRATVGDVDEQVFSFEEVAELAPGLACVECLREWLVTIGANVLLSNEEERHLRLRNALASVLQQTLMGNPPSSAERWTFPSSRGQPFCAQVFFPETANVWRVEVSDEGQRLVAAFITSLPSPNPPKALEIPLRGGELSGDEHASIQRWGEHVRRHLDRCF